VSGRPSHALSVPGVLILYGTRQGLTVHASGTAPATQTLTIDNDNERGQPYTVATGDFNADGCADLAVGDTKTAASGMVQILNGSGSGLSGSIAGRWSDDDPAILGTPGDYDKYGASLVALRISSGTRDDLLIGAPGVYTAPVNDDEYEGIVELLFSGANGLTGTGAQSFKCETPGLLGGCDINDLGDSVA
jgi:hypothetical protein